MSPHHPSRMQLEAHLQAVQRDFALPGVVPGHEGWLRDRLSHIVDMAHSTDRRHMQAMVDRVLATAGLDHAPRR
ncbi:hypothetical protein HH299_03675 [Xanthomonas sp. Kuri4-2]